MVCDKNFFDYLDGNICETIYLADGTKSQSEGVGYGYINMEAENGHSYKYKIKDVLYVPVIDCNLLSVRKLTEKNLTVNFKNDICTIENGSVLIAKAYLKGILYELKTVNEIMLTKQNTDTAKSRKLIETCKITISRNVRLIENDKLNEKDDEAENEEVIINISNEHQEGNKNNTDEKLEQEETENQMNCNETVESDEDLKTQEADEKKEVEIKNYLKLEENMNLRHLKKP
ncbi:hypothetical protein JTB14_015274 [Gonioctena quinquepunctata]|nr:hypothetical protein JTB14_015274 [Gonioctena quinquepunctata]